MEEAKMIGNAAFFDKLPNDQTQAYKELGNGADKQEKPIEKRTGFAQLQIL